MVKLRNIIAISNSNVLLHWSWCLPIFLVFAYLSIRQLYWYPPTPDEFFSMHNSGWLVGGPFSPFEIIASLRENSPGHTPVFFILLSFWGNLTGNQLAFGRVLSLFCGLLSMATVFRLSRDFVAPGAGTLAVIVAASNAFYNFYVTEVRMYTLLVLAAGAVLWLYLRILYACKTARAKDLLALGAAVCLLLNVHAFSAIFLLTLGIYHVLFAPKNRRWSLVALAVCVPVLLFLPWVIGFISSGLERISPIWSESKAGSWDTLARWLSVTTNGQPLLLVLCVGGLLVTPQRLRDRTMPVLKLAFLFIIVLWLLTDLTTYVALDAMRFHLAAWNFMLLLMAAGYYALYLKQKWLGTLTLLWIVAGASFQSNANWQAYVAGRVTSIHDPPWQVISRMAAQTEPKPKLVLHRVQTSTLDWAGRMPYSQRDYYLDRIDVSTKVIDDLRQYENYISHSTVVLPRVWMLYQKEELNQDEISSIVDSMAELDYSFCGATEVGVHSVIVDFAWEQLRCENLVPVARSQNELIDYRFYAADVDVDDDKLDFIDAWEPRSERNLTSYMMSYQLIASDGNNVAQVDLPLVHEGVARRFSIDVSDVAPGDYRLMTILYDRHTGDRVE